MKRFFITLTLLFAAIVAVNAQVGNLSKAAKLAYDYLQKEGYRPTIDEDNDVLFKAQGYTFYVDNYQNDDTYLRIVCPKIKQVDPDEVEYFAALAASNDVNVDKKFIKAYVSEKGTVSIATQTYITGDDVSEFVINTVDFISSAINAWYDAYNGYMK